MAITIYDVAKRAGVSPATVSFVYNSSRHVKRLSPATVTRVEAAIRELSYQPNAGRGAFGSSDTRRSA